MGPTDESATNFFNRGNVFTRDLSCIMRPKAIAGRHRYSPHEELVTALQGVAGLLQLPRFVVVDIRFSKGNVDGQRHLLMGDSSDAPP